MIQNVFLKGHNVPDELLELKVIEPKLLKRLAKSLVLLVLLLTVTALSALIPVLHLIIFPSMLIVTVTVVAFSLRKIKIIESGNGNCPYCKAPFHVYSRRFKFPFHDVCETCHRQVIITNTK